jgi:carboxylesterase
MPFLFSEKNAKQDEPKQLDQTLTSFTDRMQVSQHTLREEIQRLHIPSATGVLFVHGFNGKRHDMVELTEAAISYGMIACNMTLPGHEGPARDMLPFGWSDWADAVHKELMLLKTQCDRVFMVGHSLGGSLVLRTAAHEQVDGVIALCPPLRLHPLSKQFLSLIKHFIPYLPTLREDINDPEARRRYTQGQYKWTPIKPAESMVRGLACLYEELPLVTAPTMIIASTHDHVVPIRDCREIYNLLGTHEKYFITFQRSFHVIMKDYDQKDVVGNIMAFLALICAKPFNPC